MLAIAVVVAVLATLLYGLVCPGGCQGDPTQAEATSQLVLAWVAPFVAGGGLMVVVQIGRARLAVQLAFIAAAMVAGWAAIVFIE
jgi:hypothetical protein